MERNTVSGNARDGILINDATTTGTIVAGNYLGTDITGQLDRGNAWAGVAVFADAKNTRIGTDGSNDAFNANERNIISGNNGFGVYIAGSGTTNVTVRGNYVGVNRDGTAAIGNGQDGIVVNSGASNVSVGTNADGVADTEERNLVSGNAWSGVVISGAGVRNNVVAGNYVGLNAAGTSAIPNSTGVWVSAGAANTLVGSNGDGIRDAVERNVVSGNSGAGFVIVDGTTDDTVVSGNYIGTDFTGNIDVGNSSDGIYLESATDTFIKDNTISGNNRLGVYVRGAAYTGGVGGTGTVLTGNIVGLNASGTAALGNSSYGIQVDSASLGTRIGTNADGVNDAAERNIVSANGTGIAVGGAGTDNTVIRGNYIGTDISGTIDFGNSNFGISLQEWFYGGPSVGSPQAGSVIDNVVSGNNSHGIFIAGAGSNNHSITGNKIGTDVTGTLDLGNSHAGIRIENGPANIIVGGTLSSQANIISGNNLNGITVSRANDTVIVGNRIGTNANGDAAVANSQYGIQISDSAKRTRVGTNGNGQNDTEERNLISGNSQYGVVIVGVGTDDTVVAGNYIGTNALGTGRIANGWYGVATFNSAGRTRIGTDGNNNGFDANERNVVSGNALANLFVASPQAVVAGNYIGTNADGSAALTNGSLGVYLWEGAQNVRVGTDGNGLADTLERNVISGNASYGIFASANNVNNSMSYDNAIAGNYIGVNASGSTAIGNPGGGIYVSSGFRNTRIGTDGSNDAFNANERNVISGNSGPGITVTGNTTINTVIAGNWIGLSAAGGSVVANSGDGVSIVGGALGNIIGTNGDGLGDQAERNVISGNSRGIAIDGSTTANNVVAGNWVGLDSTGSVSLGNNNGAGDGIAVTNGAKNNRIGTNADGISDDFERNVVAGHTFAGIAVYNANTSNNVVAGNWVGTNAAGTTAFPNGTGISLDFASGGVGPNNNLIGTNSDGVRDDVERNVVSGNTTGILLSGTGVSQNTVAGNYVGLRPDGSTALGNSGTGISVVFGNANVISRNVISNNSTGVNINAASNTWIRGNLIGLNALGTTAAANRGNAGVLVTNGATNTMIGTNGDGIGDESERNVISGNTEEGVQIESFATSGTVVAGNYIGTNTSGTAAVPNSFSGVLVWAEARNTRIGTNGSDDSFNANERNLISGNGSFGIRTEGPFGSGTVIAGNWVGLNAIGTGALPNANGISVFDSPSARIGTNSNGIADLAERNVVSGNTGFGVSVSSGTYRMISLGRVDQLIAGTITRTTATKTISQADIRDTIGGVSGIWGYNNSQPGSGGDDYAVQTTGTLNVTTAGTYSFAISGDDGGRLRINGQDVIVDNAAHAFTTVYGQISLGVGTHTFEWIGFERNFGAGWELSVAVGNNTSAVNAGNGWKVVGDPTPHAQISLSGSMSVTAYYPTEYERTQAAIAGNYIGLLPDGSGMLPNGGAGIVITNANSNRIGANGDGVRDDVERNIISGNSVGIQLNSSSLNTIAGNYIGTDPTGMLDFGNTGLGIEIPTPTGFTSRANVIGGLTSNVGNLISGNRTGQVSFTNATGTQVVGNTIGLNATKTALIRLFATGSTGVSAFNTSGTLIDKNYLSGNSSGVNIQGGSNAVLTGNIIGLAGDGVTPIPNTRYGVLVQAGASATRVGTNGDGINDVEERNVIAASGLRNVHLLTVFDSVFAGNFVGTTVDGETAVTGAATDPGLYDIGSLRTRIGTDGSNDAFNGNERNVFAGQVNDAIRIEQITPQNQGENAVIAGNLIGVSPSGALLRNNGNGIAIGSGFVGARIGSDGNGIADDIERNIISGSSANGVLVSGAVNTSVRGNYIGTDPTGTLDFGNTARGIRIDGGTNTSIVSNLISGNSGFGMSVGGASGTRIRGNLFGTDSSGTMNLRNDNTGLWVGSGATNTVIGGSTVADRNVIAFNQGHGISLSSAGSGTQVLGNYIGIDASGLVDAGNLWAGIEVRNTPGVLIGDTSEGARNIIAGNGTGVSFHGAGTVNGIVRGNYIGLDRTGLVSLPGSEYGIFIGDGDLVGVTGETTARNITIGGTAPGAGNVISGHFRAGCGSVELKLPAILWPAIRSVPMHSDNQPSRTTSASASRIMLVAT